MTGIRTITDKCLYIEIKDRAQYREKFDFEHADVFEELCDIFIFSVTNSGFIFIFSGGI